MTGLLYWWLYIAVFYSQECCIVVQSYYYAAVLSESLIRRFPINEIFICINKRDVASFGTFVVLGDI